MPPVRVEITVPQETFDRIEAARGDVKRATWVKRAIEARLVAETQDATVRRRKAPKGAPPVSETWAR